MFSFYRNCVFLSINMFLFWQYFGILFHPILSLFLSASSLLDVLCDPTDLIWRKGTPFEAMTGRISTSSNTLLAEVSLSFPQL